MVDKDKEGRTICFIYKKNVTQTQSKGAINPKPILKMLLFPLVIVTCLLFPSN